MSARDPKPTWVVPIIVSPPSGKSGTATLSALTGLGNLTEPEPDQQAAS